MKILAHVHTFNDELVIDDCIASLTSQTYPIEEIIVVDNHSMDGTLDRKFPDKVTVLPQEENLGTSGAIPIGMEYAYSKGYDWIWVLDADSVPDNDALEKLIARYEGFPPEQREKVGFIASLPVYLPSLKPQHGGIYSKFGIVGVRPDEDAPYYPCAFNIWSGCLYRMKMVRSVGYPNKDYFLDWGEFEYGHRVLRNHFDGYIDQKSVLYHNTAGVPSLRKTIVPWGPFKLSGFEFPPLRCYYMARNMTFFSLYDNRQKWAITLLRNAIKLGRFLFGFYLQKESHQAEIKAMWRGIRDGFSNKLKNRY